MIPRLFSMRTFLLIFFLLPLFRLQAQTPQHWPNLTADSSLSASTIHVFLSGTQIPFYNWDIQPKNFNFKLYSRWGDLLGETRDPDFKIDNILKKEYLQVGEVYYVLMRFTDIYDRPHEYRLQYQYYGFYCQG